MKKRVKAWASLSKAGNILKFWNDELVIAKTKNEANEYITRYGEKVVRCTITYALPSKKARGKK